MIIFCLTDQFWLCILCWNSSVTPVHEKFEMGYREPLVTVITATNPGLLAVIKSVLDDAAIPCITRGEGFQTLYAAGHVDVLVFESDAEEARILLKNL